MKKVSGYQFTGFDCKGIERAELKIGVDNESACQKVYIISHIKDFGAVSVAVKRSQINNSRAYAELVDIGYSMEESDKLASSAKALLEEYDKETLDGEHILKVGITFQQLKEKLAEKIKELGEYTDGKGEQQIYIDAKTIDIKMPFLKELIEEIGEGALETKAFVKKLFLEGLLETSNTKTNGYGKARNIAGGIKIKVYRIRRQDVFGMGEEERKCA